MRRLSCNIHKNCSFLLLVKGARIHASILAIWNEFSTLNQKSFDLISLVRINIICHLSFALYPIRHWVCVCLSPIVSEYVPDNALMVMKTIMFYGSAICALLNYKTEYMYWIPIYYTIYQLSNSVNVLHIFQSSRCV